MDLKQQKLRAKFKAETDKDVSEENFSDYVYWLEKYKSGEINESLILENNHLKEVVQKAMDVLDDGLSRRVIPEG